MSISAEFVPCLWFDDRAEEAAEFYVAIFPNSRITGVSRYGNVGFEFHGKTAGSVLTVEFELGGQKFTALNGGPMFKFTEAMSLQVNCDSQAEIDHYWAALTAGGDAEAQQCGWLKDKFGLSWQIKPARLTEMITGADIATMDRIMTALHPMKKLDSVALERAYRGDDAASA